MPLQGTMPSPHNHHCHVPCMAKGGWVMAELSSVTLDVQPAQAAASSCCHLWVPVSVTTQLPILVVLPDHC